jgi:hypothetical protein
MTLALVEVEKNIKNAADKERQLKINFLLWKKEKTD